MNDSPNSRAQRGYSLRTLLEVVAVVAFVLFLLYGQYGRTGRYQLVNSTWGLNSNMKATYLVDTQTGATWYADGSGWQAMERK